MRSDVSKSPAMRSQNKSVRCLVYMSRGTKALSDEDLQSILQTSRRNNSQVGVTGILIYIRDTFFQLLEGPADAVEQTYLRITKDPRHQGIIKLKDFETAERHFPEWTMGYRTPTSAQVADLPGFSDLGRPGSEDRERLRTHASNIFDLIRSFVKP